MPTNKLDADLSKLSSRNVNDIARYCFKKRSEPFYASTECYLNYLFRIKYPENTDVEQVYAKVHALNVLYGAGVFTVDEEPMAKHIVSVKDLDSRLRGGCEDVVKEIACFSREPKRVIRKDKKTYVKSRTYYVFATKFCSFHQPKLFPIVDSTVRKLLCDFLNGKKGDHACTDRSKPSITLTKLSCIDQYSLYKEAVCMFMKWYESLGANEEYRLRCFKKADMFLWTYNKYWDDVQRIIEETSA